MRVDRNDRKRSDNFVDNRLFLSSQIRKSEKLDLGYRGNVHGGVMCKNLPEQRNSIGVIFEVVQYRVGIECIGQVNESEGSLLRPFAAHLIEFTDGLRTATLPGTTGFLPDRQPLFWTYQRINLGNTSTLCALCHAEILYQPQLD